MQIHLQPEVPTAAGAHLAADAESLAYHLFAVDRLAQFTAAGLPQSQAETLVQMQWRGRNLTYAAQYPGVEDWIISLEDGVAVGRCSLQKTAQGLRLVDLVILPEYRSRGIATQVLRQLAQENCGMKSVFSLRVGKNNPALHLYARVGFNVVEEDELFYEMVLQNS